MLEEVIRDHQIAGNRDDSSNRDAFVAALQSYCVTTQENFDGNVIDQRLKDVRTSLRESSHSQTLDGVFAGLITA